MDEHCFSLKKVHLVKRGPPLEAIGELIAAIIGGFAQLMVGFLELAVMSIAMLCEFLFLLLTQGLAAANDKYATRKKEMEAKQKAPHPIDDESVEPQVTPIDWKYVGVATVVGILVVAVLVTANAIREKIRKQRIATTTKQVETLAENYVKLIKNKQNPNPQPGKLPNRDSWNQPIELFVDKMLVGTLIVVRSAGPDRKTGSLDDILCIKTAASDVKDVGGELAKRGVNAIKNRVKRLVNRDQKEQEPQIEQEPQ